MQFCRISIIVYHIEIVYILFVTSQVCSSGKLHMFGASGTLMQFLILALYILFACLYAFPLILFSSLFLTYCPVWAWERCRISPPCFLAECCKRQLNQGSFVLLYFRLFTFLICIEFICIFLYCFVCQYQSSDWL